MLQVRKQYAVILLVLSAVLVVNYVYLGTTAFKGTQKVLYRSRTSYTGLQVLLSNYRLPPIRNLTHPEEKCAEEIIKLVQPTQVYRSAADIGATLETGAVTFGQANDMQLEFKRRLEMEPTTLVSANVNSFSDLQEYIESGRKVTIMSLDGIKGNTPLLINNTKNLVVDFRRAEVVMDIVTTQRYMLHVENSVNIVLLNMRLVYKATPPVGFYQKDGDFKAGHLLVHRSHNVTIKGSTLVNSQQAGMTLSDSSGLWIVNNVVRDSGAGGIIVHGNVSGSLLQENRVVGGTGIANWHAGIVLTYRDIDILTGVSFLLSRHLHHDPDYSLLKRRRYPHGNVLLRNKILRSRAQGVYLDGCVGNALIGNEIDSSEKEGLCIDGGSASNVLHGNFIHNCGRRGNQAPHVLKQEVPDNRTGSDGLTIFKLPGVSIDNGVYNILSGNMVASNHGGGIKMVRTSFYNVVLANVVNGNDRSLSKHIAFPGVMLLSDPSDDIGAQDLDFTGSKFNIVAYNELIGQHERGIYIRAGCSCNEIYKNKISGYKIAAIDSTTSQTNFIQSIHPGWNRRSPERKPKGIPRWPFGEPFLWWEA